MTIDHFELTLIAVSAAILFSVPTGIILTRFSSIATPVLGMAAAVQTIPSLALFGLVIPLLMFINLPIIGWVPALMALFLYALLPILRNTYTGILQVDPAVIEAATGIGMTDRQILWKIELPMSVPVIMAGIRTSTVISVGITTLAALIGAGGLGELIFRGLRTINFKLMLAGAIPAAMLALFLDAFLARLEKSITPRGLKVTK